MERNIDLSICLVQMLCSYYFSSSHPLETTLASAFLSLHQQVAWLKALVEHLGWILSASLVLTDINPQFQEGTNCTVLSSACHEKKLYQPLVLCRDWVQSSNSHRTLCFLIPSKILISGNPCLLPDDSSAEIRPQLTQSYVFVPFLAHHDIYLVLRVWLCLHFLLLNFICPSYMFETQKEEALRLNAHIIKS